jgi:para-nitrobenzyl esterase
MLWIHGGGFQFGSAAQPTYDGSYLAAEGVILASINYRLNVFGFLALPDLDKEGSPSGNFGLQDMQLALSWVKKNIALFGGDPDNVTIFGESAGAHAVGLLMASPRSKTLFHKAIMESGAFWDSSHGPLDSFAQARQQGLSLTKKLNASSLSQLRALSPQALIAAAPWPQNTDPTLTSFAPSVDGYILPVIPGTAFANSQQMKVPLLAGFNTDEELPFLAQQLPHSTAA